MLWCGHCIHMLEIVPIVPPIHFVKNRSNTSVCSYLCQVYFRDPSIMKFFPLELSWSWLRVLRFFGSFSGIRKSNCLATMSLFGYGSLLSLWFILSNTLGIGTVFALMLTNTKSLGVLDISNR